MDKEKSYYTKEVSDAVREMTARPKRKYLKIIASKINEKWSIDLMDYNGFGFRYILCVVDIYSRKAGAWMMRTKTAESTLEAFKKIVSYYFNDTLCEQVLTDDGSEWKSSFKQYLIDNNVIIQTAASDGSDSRAHHNQQGHVERFIRTLRMLIKNFKEEEEQTTMKEADLKVLLKAYNNHPHRGLGKVTPNDVYEGKVKPKNVMYYYHIYQPKFKVGDKVRVLLQKQTYANKKLLNYGKRVYVIMEKQKNRYLLDNGEILPYTRLILSSSDITEEEQQDIDIKRAAKEEEEKRKRYQKRMLDRLK